MIGELLTSGGGTYTVQTDDSQASIAYRHYGKTKFQQEILLAKRDKLHSFNQFVVGIQLALPALWTTRTIEQTSRLIRQA